MLRSQTKINRKAPVVLDMAETSKVRRGINKTYVEDEGPSKKKVKASSDHPEAEDHQEITLVC